MTTTTIKAGYKQTEIGVIPEDWEVKSLGEVSNFSNGKGHEQSIDDFGDYIVVNSKFISTVGKVSKYSNLNLAPLSAGTITIVMSDIPNGKALAKCFLIEKDNKYTLNQRIGGIKPKNGDSKYFFYQLNRNKYFIDFDSGTGQTNLKKNEVLNCPILTPSKPEQTLIAKTLSDTDELISSLDALISKKRRIKEGAMQELLTGKKRLAGFSGEWEVKKLGEVADIKKGQLITDSTRVNGSIPVVAGGKTPAYYHNQANRYGKTITISASGASAGYIAYYNIPIFASDCSTIEESKKYSIKYMYFLLLSLQEKIYKMQIGGAQPHIHASDIKPIQISFPTLPEQQAIAKILSDMDTEITALEQKREKYKLIKQGMMQQLLTGKIRLIDNG